MADSIAQLRERESSLLTGRRRAFMSLIQLIVGMGGEAPTSQVDTCIDACFGNEGALIVVRNLIAEAERKAFLRKDK
jgi:hypothetical protein